MSDEFNKEKKGLSIASLILGIIGVCTACIIYVGPILGILAIIFAGLSLHKKEGIKGVSIAGLVLGIIAAGLTVILALCIGSLAAIVALAGM